MGPTDMAKIQFEAAGNWGQRVVEGNSSNPSDDLKNIAAACRDIAGGLSQMAVGLRATYILLEELKRTMTDPNRRGPLRP